MKKKSKEVLVVEAIFFDFDGVIVDSNKTKAEGFRRLFAEVDKEVQEEIIRYHRLHGGISRVEKIRYAYREILQQPLNASQLDALAQRYSELVVEKVVAAPWLPGAIELLDKAKPYLPLFLISGTPQDELRDIVARKGISHYFQEILGSPIKKPEHIKNVLARFNLAPERCVFIGDALTDYHAAVATRMPFIGVLGEVEFPEDTLVVPDCRAVPGLLALAGR
jgi:HAD superfamily hydrolase (TIGR01549 family)